MAENARDVLARTLGRVRLFSCRGQQADELLAALDAAGLVVVPKVPTADMLGAPLSMVGWHELGQTLHHAGVPHCLFDAAYRAMLAASPKP